MCFILIWHPRTKKNTRSMAGGSTGASMRKEMAADVTPEGSEDRGDGDDAGWSPDQITYHLKPDRRVSQPLLEASLTLFIALRKRRSRSTLHRGRQPSCLPPFLRTIPSSGIFLATSLPASDARLPVALPTTKRSHT